MSRPPFPHPTNTTGGDQTGDLGQLDYLPLAYGELLDLQQRLAATRLHRAVEQDTAEVGAGDVARTFMELSALVAHVLSVYQRYYAGEAFLSTAQSPSSLVRHAHRLAYEPDPGLSASGYVVLFTKDGVTGTVAAGLPLASVPLGEIKSQDYETGDDLAVDVALNEVVPLEARRRVTSLDAGLQTLRLVGVGHGFAVGDVVALVGNRWIGLVVRDVAEDRAAGVTTITLDRALGGSLAVDASAPPVVLAQPALSLQPFGTDADPTLFPPPALKAATGTKPNTADAYWYTVQRADGGQYDEKDIYLSQQLDDRLAGGYVVRAAGSELTVLRVTGEAAATVTFTHAATESFATQKVAVTPQKDGGFLTELKNAEKKDDLKLTLTNHVAATVTALQLVDVQGDQAKRTDQPLPARWFAKWSVEADVATDEPNPTQVASPLLLPGLLSALTPGRPLVFVDLAGTKAQVVTVIRAEVDETSGATSVWFDPLTPAPAEGWALDDLKVYGNVARVSHGRTVQETLGGSDGVSPFQRFDLKESPVTILLDVAGGEPQLDVRIDGILWQRVEDFAASGPDDRHYRISTDAGLATSVVFGDGRNGAVPPSGKKNIEATYRVGLGRAGDVEPPRLSRLKRANPLLDHAINVSPVSGGAEPADAEAIRAQATRWIRTFDRAVSASDLADLALTMPGIARAASLWEAAGAVLVVATAEGDAPPALAAVRTFLDARRDVAVPLRVKGPTARAIRLDVEVEPDPAYLVEIVKDGLRRALYGDDPASPGMFTFAARGLGQPAFLSEVYERLEAVAGVVGVRVTHFEGGGTETVANVVTAEVDEWLQLVPNALTVTTVAPVVAR